MHCQISLHETTVKQNLYRVTLLKLYAKYKYLSFHWFIEIFHKNINLSYIWL